MLVISQLSPPQYILKALKKHFAAAQVLRIATEKRFDNELL